MRNMNKMLLNMNKMLLSMNKTLLGVNKMLNVNEMSLIIARCIVLIYAISHPNETGFYFDKNGSSCIVLGNWGKCLDFATVLNFFWSPYKTLSCFEVKCVQS